MLRREALCGIGGMVDAVTARLDSPPRERASFLEEDIRPELPPPSPLVMPIQSLRGAPLAASALASSPADVSLRRGLVIGATAVTTVLAAGGTARALMVDDIGLLDPLILLVAACLFAWTSFWFFTAVAGLAAPSRGPDALGIDPLAAPPLLTTRTAILAPVYNEDTTQVFARLQAVHESLRATRQGEHFDLFILSDSTDAAVRAAERRAFEVLRRRAAGSGSVYYRHRLENRGRKAGNVADWVARFGGAYAFMVVLDADSLMSGEALAHLAGAMERHPDVGLIQTVPVIVNRSNLLGRTQQFASRIYGPLLARGLAWWSGAEGNYWGHNAIIRTKAFAAHAGLPCLPGRKPFGGEIMSHDFVEAALIRRAGYGVHMAPDLGGSFEESPPTLAALIKRDRRWCQGNLQHLGVLPASGLHWVSRLHLLNGVAAYITAPLWMMLLSLSALLRLWPELGGRTLAQAAPLSGLESGGDLAAAGWILLLTMALLLAPKLLAFGVAMADPPTRRDCGGVRNAFAGLLLETLASTLIAPIIMLCQTKALVDLALGRDAGWAAQDRAEGRLDLAEALRRHGWHTGAGAVLSAVALAASPDEFLCLSPALLGLIGSIPLAALLARGDLGLAARRRGWLVTPEEAHPPRVVARASQLALDAGAGSVEELPGATAESPPDPALAPRKPPEALAHAVQ